MKASAQGNSTAKYWKPLKQTCGGKTQMRSGHVSKRTSASLGVIRDDDCVLYGFFDET